MAFAGIHCSMMISTSAKSSTGFTNSRVWVQKLISYCMLRAKTRVSVIYIYNYLLSFMTMILTEKVG